MYDHQNGNVDPRQMTRKAAWYPGKKMGWEDEMKYEKKYGERPLWESGRDLFSF